MEKMPFVYGQLAEQSDFANRKVEIQQLVNNFHNSLNTVLISPRRWGKSSLVKKATKIAVRKNKNLRACYLDCYNIQTEQDFYKKFAESILRGTAARWEEVGLNVKKFLRNFIPKISYSPDKWQDFSIGLQWDEIKRSPSEILNLGETICKHKNIKLVICIDEFQDISVYKNSQAFQKTLRAHWQHHQRVSYCLYGSKRHMLTELFNAPSMPFYNFGDVIFLEKIKPRDWQAFIVRRFKATGKKISRDLALKIAAGVANHPYYVQQLAQAVWLRTGFEAEEKTIHKALTDLINQMSLLFHTITESLSKKQVSFLMAVANHEEKLSSGKIIKKYHLGTSASVNQIKKALIEKEIIDIRSGVVSIQNPLYEIWLQQNFSK